jgi:hypothetical protein
MGRRETRFRTPSYQPRAIYDHAVILNRRMVTLIGFTAIHCHRS